MPTYGKKLKKIFSGAKRPMTLKLGTILRQGQIWSLMLLYGEKGKTMTFSETIVGYDVKVGRCSQLNDYMHLYE